WQLKAKLVPSSGGRGRRSAHFSMVRAQIRPTGGAFSVSAPRLAPASACAPAPADSHPLHRQELKSVEPFSSEGFVVIARSFDNRLEPPRRQRGTRDQS